VKHPVLRIKKDAETDPVFHYDREKRLRLGSARSAPGSGIVFLGGVFRGFFRGFLGGFRRGSGKGRGRRRMLPVLLVVLAAVIVMRFIPRTSGRAVVAGQEAVLRATPFQDALLVSVTFTPRGRAGGSAAGRETTVLFVLPDTGERLLVSEQLGEGPSTIRGRMRYTGGEKKLTADVRVADAHAGLRIALKKP
jgi:hypothetical protein